jgi:hypothetical protein
MIRDREAGHTRRALRGSSSVYIGVQVELSCTEPINVSVVDVDVS